MQACALLTSPAPRRKVHLFDIDIPGKITFKESTNLTPGGPALPP